jgi:hypothetical protein
LDPSQATQRRNGRFRICRPSDFGRRFGGIDPRSVDFPQFGKGVQPAFRHDYLLFCEMLGRAPPRTGTKETIMNRFLKAAILSVAAASTTLAALPAAQAGDGWRHGGRAYYGGAYYSGGDIAAAGIVGLAVGALVGGALAQPSYGYYEPTYVVPRRYPQPRPSPIRGDVLLGPVDRYAVGYADEYAGAMEPWTPEWYGYCSDRYRTFNARTGTFVGYDGLTHFCVAN